MEKWEYKIINTTSMTSRELERGLNQEGQEGWELVILIENNDLSMIFKRKIQEE